MINEINEKGLTDPVEILKLLQLRLIKGRALDIGIRDTDLPPNPSDEKNATNYICVDREKILKTTFDELSGISFLHHLRNRFHGRVSKGLWGTSQRVDPIG